MTYEVPLEHPDDIVDLTVKELNAENKISQGWIDWFNAK